MSDRDTLDLEADDGTTSEELEPWRAARMFTLVHITPYDSYVAGWDSKYHWDFWRP
ncbi:MAG TPA: hypothetical protein VIT65_07965 [Microlunatus sp.]